MKKRMPIGKVLADKAAKTCLWIYRNGEGGALKMMNSRCKLNQMDSTQDNHIW